MEAHVVIVDKEDIRTRRPTRQPMLLKVKSPSAQRLRMLGLANALLEAVGQDIVDDNVV